MLCSDMTLPTPRGAVAPKRAAPTDAARRTAFDCHELPCRASRRVGSVSPAGGPASQEARGRTKPEPRPRAVSARSGAERLGGQLGPADPAEQQVPTTRSTRAAVPSDQFSVGRSPMGGRVRERRVAPSAIGWDTGCVRTGLKVVQEASGAAPGAAPGRRSRPIVGSAGPTEWSGRPGRRGVGAAATRATQRLVAPGRRR